MPSRLLDPVTITVPLNAELSPFRNKPFWLKTPASVNGPLPVIFPLMVKSGDAPFTWRVALAWVGWVITAVLAVGAVVDLRNAETGHKVSHDSPYAGQELKLVAKRQKRISRR